MCVRVCVHRVCVTYIYSDIDMHPSIRTYIHSCKFFMYVEVWNIMVCSQFFFWCFAATQLARKAGTHTGAKMFQTSG